VALRSRVLAAVAAALPLALAAGCSGGTVPGAPAAQAGPAGGIPAGPAPGPQTLSETGSTLLFPAPDRRRRIELVEAANTVRPRTWV
jgi:hypothetical protein